jgi:penicillin amidase
MEIREEVIKIKDQPDTTIQVRTSRHGPIINDAFASVQDSQTVALWWIYLQQANNLMSPAYNYPMPEAWKRCNRPPQRLFPLA